MTVKWVDTDQGAKREPLIHRRLVARDFRDKGDKDGQDYFGATTPLETKRMLSSKAASLTSCGRRRKLLLIDAKKAHTNPPCDEDA